MLEIILGIFEIPRDERRITHLVHICGFGITPGIPTRWPVRTATVFRAMPVGTIVRFPAPQEFAISFSFA